MSAPTVKIALSASEWRLVAALRAVPLSPLREKALELCEAVVEFAREPRCPEMQADGVPCEAPGVACEQCLHVDGLMEALRRRTLEARGVAGTPA